MQPLELDQALTRVLAEAAPLEAVARPVAAARGAVLATSLRARWQLPLADTSTMDGWALRAADLDGADAPCRLRKRSESAAGHPTSALLGPGEASRISTGALLPVGADAVVAQEDVLDDDDDDDGMLVIDLERAGRVEPGHFVRRAGSEVAEDELLIEAPRRLDPPQLALLAGAGHATIPIIRPPKVAILCTGDELLPIGSTPRPGQVISTNGMMLAGLVADLGACPLEQPPVGDDRRATIDGIAAAIAGADVLLTSGGISVGDHDHVGPALRALGLDPLFTRLNLRPGRPLTFGKIGATRVFALPGNPASTYVTFELLVRPLLCRLLGLPQDWRRPRRRLRLTAPAKGAGSRLHVVRATARGELATPLRQQASGSLRSLAGHNALLLIPPGAGALPAGATVETILIEAP